MSFTYFVLRLCAADRMCSSPRFPSWHAYSNIGWLLSRVRGMVKVNGCVQTSGSLKVTCHCSVFGPIGREALNERELLAVVPIVVAEVCLVGEVGGLNHERVALPMPARITKIFAYC